MTQNAAPRAHVPIWEAVFLLSAARREGNYWTFARLIRGMLRLNSFFANWHAQVEILDFLRTPAFRGMIRKHPMFPVKYLRGNYLYRGLATELRAAALVHHYRFMQERIAAPLLRRILFDKLLLWQTEADSNRFEIGLSLSDPVDSESEFSLYFDLNGATIFILGFSVVPGNQVETDSAHALLIARLQGASGQSDNFRLARKLLCDVVPPGALLAALQGIADVLDIRSVAGLCSAHNNCFGVPKGSGLEERYERFFAARGMTQSPSGQFCLGEFPLPEKPLKAIKPGHRLRTKTKRAIKAKISMATAEAFRRANAAAN